MRYRWVWRKFWSAPLASQLAHHRQAAAPAGWADEKKGRCVGTMRQRPKSEGGTLIVSLSTPLRAPPILPYCFRYYLDRRHPTRKVAAAGRHSRRARRLSTTKARHISSSQS